MRNQPTHPPFLLSGGPRHMWRQRLPGPLRNAQGLKARSLPTEPQPPLRKGEGVGSRGPEPGP
eukprot:15468103-Alexandrium_andersonii.AAC.1